VDCVDVSGDFQLTPSENNQRIREDGCKTACSSGSTAFAHPEFILEIGTMKGGEETLVPPGKRHSPDKLINIGNGLGGRFVDALKTEQVADHIFFLNSAWATGAKVGGI